MLDPQVRALLEAPNFVHLATMMADGSPHSVAVWCGFAGDNPCFFTQPGSVKARNVERDPRVAMSVIDRENPYRTGQLRGKVVQVQTGDYALAVMDQMSIKHTGERFPVRRGQLYVIDVERSAFSELPFKDR
jgi:PPOX class probable F420-dependent enzyme